MPHFPCLDFLPLFFLARRKFSNLTLRQSSKKLEFEQEKRRDESCVSHFLPKALSTIAMGSKVGVLVTDF